jgi:hypothetical protein
MKMSSDGSVCKKEMFVAKRFSEKAVTDSVLKTEISNF